MGIFVVLILFLLYRQLFYAKSNGKILVFLPCLLNLLSLVVGSGWATYRYFWPTTLLSLLIYMSSGKNLKSGGVNGADNLNAMLK